MLPRRFYRSFPALLALVLSMTAARADLRIVGSDLLGAEFTREILAHAGKAGKGVRPAFDGSRSGLEELRAGRADLAIVVLPSAELKGLESLILAPIGYHAVIVAVPAKCPLADITFAQLARAFGIAPTPLPASWSDLGATGAWETSPVVTIAPSPASGFTVDFFQHVVLGDREPKPALHRFGQPAELATEFSGEAKPIALLTHPRQCPAAARVLAVSASADQPAFLPTPENLHAHDYPLGLPLQIAIRRESREALLPMLRFLLGAKIADVLDRAGMIALPPAARARERAALERH